ncbi:hypothetical protein FLONG3_3270 [Fusarium longipes]|uniref:Cyanovirin-N domain-containing protein n=1 Tax=Fusarium longipes TaxID=694270 RepID=A0A395T1Q9_9HYPO|nr:hypothetical protein FLONG3_3270 [Fusarium longipes]
MLYNFSLLALSLAVCALAAPALPEVVESNMSHPNITDRDCCEDGKIKIAFGQQLQNYDQQNWWVAWEHGEPACPGQRQIRRLVQPVCNQEFTIKGHSMKFVGCDHGDPEYLELVGQGRRLECGSHGKNGYKIGCHNQHDIKQHGYCE